MKPNFKNELTRAMDALAANPQTRFIGYGLKKGRALGTLANVPDSQIVETTVAENLMVGMAIGMSLVGLRPVVYFERFDFMMNAMDALVNHLDKIEHESGGEFSPSVIIRATVGNKQKPLFTGSTHTADYSKELYPMLRKVEVLALEDAAEVENVYKLASDGFSEGFSYVISEYKDRI